MTTKHWNAIAKMVNAGDMGIDGIEDIGRKKIGDQIVHEFMINHELYRIERVEK